MTEKRFKVTNVSINGMVGLFKLGNDSISVYDIVRLLNELLEENERLKQKVNFYKYFQKDARGLEKENEQLKKVLGAILLEVKRDITNTNQTGEIKVFINPNSFEMISEVLRKYGALKEWYE